MRCHPVLYHPARRALLRHRGHVASLGVRASFFPVSASSSTLLVDTRLLAAGDVDLSAGAAGTRPRPLAPVVPRGDVILHRPLARRRSISRGISLRHLTPPPLLRLRREQRGRQQRVQEGILEQVLHEAHRPLPQPSQGARAAPGRRRWTAHGSTGTPRSRPPRAPMRPWLPRDARAESDGVEHPPRRLERCPVRGDRRKVPGGRRGQLGANLFEEELGAVDVVLDARKLRVQLGVATVPRATCAMDRGSRGRQRAGLAGRGTSRGGFQAEGRMLTFQSIQSMPYALAQFPYRGVHRQQRRAFLVRARVIGEGILRPVPTPTRRAAAVSTARRLGRAARRARGSTADPFATARRSLRPRPPHRAVGTCLGDGAPRTGSLLVICEGAECAVVAVFRTVCDSRQL